MPHDDPDGDGDGDAAGLRTVGVLGGMSSQSTVAYYRGLNAGVNDALGGHHGADALVYSVDFADVERFIAEERWDDAGDYLANAAGRLERGGADFVVMATNTMHRVAGAIEDALSIPFVHIVDVTADAVRAAGVDTVGVLGTRATMEAAFYRDRFAEHGIDVLVPDAAARDRVDDVIFDELVHDVVREEARRSFLDVMESLVADGAGGIVLGCTEIEMLVGPGDFDAVPLFDTTALHVERSVERCLGDRALPE